MTIKEHLIKNQEEYAPWIINNDQGRIDYKILPYLQDIDNGFFIEAGALNGLFQSNTKLLEELGWTGLLVEPSVPAYHKCLENRNCFIENCALVSSDYENETVFGDFDNDGEYGIGARASIKESGVEVKATTLTKLLDNLNVSHVDFLSLDVEGHEIEVLKGIDFNRIDITFMLIEVNSDFYTLNDLDSFLLTKGYENIKNLSNFRVDNTPNWPGNHQDYLYKKIK
jgi:FkbM family methyltransferase